MMRAKLLSGIAALVLHASAAHACALEVKILKDNSLHVLVRCVDVEMFHEDMRFYYPKGGPNDVDHECKLLEVEQIDKAGSLAHMSCKYREEGKKHALAIQLSGYDILITNTENY